MSDLTTKIIEMIPPVIGGLMGGGTLLALLRRQWAIVVAIGLAAGAFTYAIWISGEYARLADTMCPSTTKETTLSLGKVLPFPSAIVLKVWTSGEQSAGLTITPPEAIFSGGKPCEKPYDQRGPSCRIITENSSIELVEPPSSIRRVSGGIYAATPSEIVAPGATSEAD